MGLFESLTALTSQLSSSMSNASLQSFIIYFSSSVANSHFDCVAGLDVFGLNKSSY